MQHAYDRNLKNGGLDLQGSTLSIYMYSTPDFVVPSRLAFVFPADLRRSVASLFWSVARARARSRSVVCLSLSASVRCWDERRGAEAEPPSGE